MLARQRRRMVEFDQVVSTGVVVVDTPVLCLLEGSFFGRFRRTGSLQSSYSDQSQASWEEGRMGAVWWPGCC